MVCFVDVCSSGHMQGVHTLWVPVYAIHLFIGRPLNGMEGLAGPVGKTVQWTWEICLARHMRAQHGLNCTRPCSMHLHPKPMQHQSDQTQLKPL